MKLHRKAKTTPASRAALVQRALAGESYETIAAGMQISERTVAKWVQRFRRGGTAALPADARDTRPPVPVNATFVQLMVTDIPERPANAEQIRMENLQAIRGAVVVRP